MASSRNIFFAQKKINPDWKSKRGRFWVHKTCSFFKNKTNEEQDRSVKNFAKSLKSNCQLTLTSILFVIFFAKLKLAIFAECCNHRVQASDKHCCWPNALMSTSYNKF